MNGDRDMGERNRENGNMKDLNQEINIVYF